MLIRKTRTAQWPLVQGFNFSFDDQVIGTGNAPVNANGPFVSDVIGLPPGATVTGGSLIIEQAFDAGATIAVGDSANPTRYLAATAATAIGRTSLVLTGYKGNGEDIRVTKGGTAGGTTGRAALNVMYIVANRANEVQIT